MFGSILRKFRKLICVISIGAYMDILREYEAYDNPCFKRIKEVEKIKEAALGQLIKNGQLINRAQCALENGDNHKAHFLSYRVLEIFP